LKGYIDSVINDSDTVIVNRGAGTGIVLMSLEEYNAIRASFIFGDKDLKLLNE